MFDNASSVHCASIENYGKLFDYVRVALFSLIISVSFFGNMAVIAVLYFNKPMRTFTNLLICNSALADLLITLVPNVYEIIDILKYRGTWVLGSFMCTFLYMCIYLSVAATVITLMIVTTDRFLAVMLPYKKYLKKNMLPVVVIVIWCLAFMCSSPTTFVQKVKHHEGFGEYCTEIWPPPFDKVESPKHYTLILFFVLYALPLILMGAMYAIMAQKLKGSGSIVKTLAIQLRFRKVVKNKNRNENDSDQTIPDENYQETERINGRSSTVEIQNNVMTSGMKHKQRVIRMLMAVVFVFALCWLPVYVIQFLAFFHPTFMRCPHMMPTWAVFLAFLMQYANSALNPLIYFTFSRTYRKGFKTVLQKLFNKKLH